MDRHGRDNNYVVDHNYVVVFDDDNCKFDHDNCHYVVDRDYVVVDSDDDNCKFDVDDITVTRPRVH